MAMEHEALQTDEQPCFSGSKDRSQAKRWRRRFMYESGTWEVPDGPTNG